MLVAQQFSHSFSVVLVHRHGHLFLLVLQQLLHLGLTVHVFCGSWVLVQFSWCGGGGKVGGEQVSLVKVKKQTHGKRK